MQLGNTWSEAFLHDQQLQEIGAPFTHPFPILGDNSGAITLTMEARFYNSMKCIRLSEHLARILGEQETIMVKYIIMPASAAAPPHERWRSLDVISGKLSGHT